LGAVFKPIDQLAVKLLYGQSYLAPMWAHTQANDGNFYGNPALKPETFENIDFIVAYQDKKFNASADLYYNYFTGLINSVRFDPTSPNLQYRNSGDAVYLGADLAADARILPWLRLNAGYSLIVPNTTVPEDQSNFDTQPDPRGPTAAGPRPDIKVPKRARRGTSPNLLVYDYDTGKKKIKDIPTHTFRYGVRLDPIPNLTISLWGRAYSQVWTTDNVTTTAVDAARVTAAMQATGTNTLPKTNIDPVFLLDAALMYNLNWATVQVSGFNLTNRKYEIGGSGMPRPLRRQGLNVEGSLAVKW
jgi:outer membrane receptor protein involved in Fe transport